MQLVAGCPPCLDRQTHIYTWSACLLAVDHGLTWRTGDGPVIKHWRYHSSSHLYSPSSPPPYTSSCHSLFLTFCLSMTFLYIFLHPVFFILSNPSLLPLPFLLNPCINLHVCTNIRLVDFISLTHFLPHWDAGSSCLHRWNWGVSHWQEILKKKSLDLRNTYWFMGNKVLQTAISSCPEMLISFLH